MGKKPDQPPIDLSAKRTTSAKTVESSAPVASAIPAATIPIAKAPVAQAPVAKIPIAKGPVAPIPIAPIPIDTAPVEHNCDKACPTPPEETIRVGAYYRWDAAGRPGGDGVRFWLEAEQELLAGGASIAEECLQQQ